MFIIITINCEVMVAKIKVFVVVIIIITIHECEKKLRIKQIIEFIMQIVTRLLYFLYSTLIRFNDACFAK